MSIAKESVAAWLVLNFEPDEVTTEDYPLLPGGLIIRDKTGGEMLCWWDFLSEKVCYKIKE